MKINNGYVNNRQRMNNMIKRNIINNRNKNKSIPKKEKERNNSSQRYLDLYQKEKTINKNLLTPDVNKKSIKKYNANYNYNEYLTLDNDIINILGPDEEKINNNINLLSNSFDISRSLVNIEDYINLYYNSQNKNPFLDKVKEKTRKNEEENKINQKIIAKYSYKNKKWILIEEYNINNNCNIYWKEYPDFNSKEGIDTNDESILDFNSFEEKHNSLKLEYNKLLQMFNDLNNKYEQINKKNKEIKTKLNYYMVKIKEIEKDKEKYIKKNKKLKEEINKIPFLIEQEMNKFREEAGKKISKKIYDLEQENKILKGERYKLKERKIFNEYEIKFNINNDET